MQTFLSYYQLKITNLPLDKISNIFRKILPIYWAFLTYMLLRPGSEEQEHFILFPHIDKLVHFLIFSALSFFLVLAFPKIKFYIFIYIILIYAVLTEILQSKMGFGRSAEFLDILADLFGALFGYFFVRKFDVQIRKFISNYIH